MMENQEALDLKREINRLIKQSDKINMKISDKTHQLKLVCIHNERESKNEHVAGGYLDREQYIKILVCKVCGKEIARKVKYGWFE